ncbi:DUF2235 domain-containing protein [Yokenella regensburgei]|uniref:PAAR domain-containing protein n=1 Tax=Yokenella regensburgei TaxID=158877 RepID=UPI003F14620A
MTKGHFLVIGDRTTCGGIIIDGAEDYVIEGEPQAREFDRVTCGKHTGIYIIVGGVPEIYRGGRRMAGSQHSRSSCPCHAKLIASKLNVEYGVYEQYEPEQRAQSGRKSLVGKIQSASEDCQQCETEEKLREITLTLGLFFDGTGNNAFNISNMMQGCTADLHGFSDPAVEDLLRQCADASFDVKGIGATSYLGYYTNVHWLATLYRKKFNKHETHMQQAIYIDGIGTESGKPDSVIGQGLGISDTGVLAKTDKAISLLSSTISRSIQQLSSTLPADNELILSNLQFDIFGFSRGAAAARHFANRIHAEESIIVEAIRKGTGEIPYKGAPAGKVRFIGIMDTVAAIGTPVNGLNPHTADTGEVNIVLRPGVAEKVFHITAENECRFNFALNSVQPAWPELSLPGVHSDIGGGYLPIVFENLFLTRPETDTVPANLPGEQTRGYRQTLKKKAGLKLASAMAPIVHTTPTNAETWCDDRLPPDRYGVAQKRNYAALTVRNRKVKHDWSKVVLRVMLDAAQDAGVLFDNVETNDEFTLPDELIPLREKAIRMGKAVRSGKIPPPFTLDELDIIGDEYIHCSAHWNPIKTDKTGMIQGGAHPSVLIGFVNRPDDNWQRTIYDMDGHKI